MQIPWGKDAWEAKNGRDIPVTWDSSQLVNGHMLFVAMSGGGKTYNLKRIIKSLCSTAKNPPRFHVLDVHGDIHIDGASTVQFSEQTPYGLNPLRINPDPHFGGVRKRIQGFIATMNKVMHQLGSKQESCLRNLLRDVYSNFGFRQDDPLTWEINEAQDHLVTDGDANRLYLDVPKGEKEEFKELKKVAGIGGSYTGEPLFAWWIPTDQYKGAITRWPPKLISRTHPSIADVLRYARHRMQQSFLGTGMPGTTALEVVNRMASAYQRRYMDSLKRGETGYEDSAAQADLDKAREKAIAAYTDAIGKIKTGDELDDLMKYDSTDVLKSVVDRLENLDNIGIFRPTPPPFDPSCPVWRYDIKALDKIERKLFVLYRLEEIFARAVQRGEQSEIVEFIILDEAHIFCDDDPDNIISTIAKEARKFGLSLILASQSPTHFTEDFIASVGTKVVLGIDEMYWKGSATKMRLTEEALAWIKLKHSALIQMKTHGEARNTWKRVIF